MPYGRSVLTLACAATAVLVLSPPAAAQTVVKIGNISSYSGFVAQAADQAQKAVDLYVKEHEKELAPGIKLESCGATTRPIRKSASGWLRS